MGGCGKNIPSQYFSTQIHRRLAVYSPSHWRRTVDPNTHFSALISCRDSPTRFVFFVPLSPNYRMRTVAKIILSCVSFLLVLIWASSCGPRRNRECEKRIAEGIHVGVPVETADGVLKRCGFKTTSDVAKDTLYADKRVGGLIVERTQVLITLDSDKKVA